MTDNLLTRKFKPVVCYDSDSGWEITEMILTDAPMVWTQVLPGVDCGYDFETGDLVGIRIWKDVRRRD